MSLYANGEGEFERGGSPWQLTIHMKTGDSLWIVNRMDALVEIADRLMSDSEFDGGDGVVEIRGVKLTPHPIQTIMHVKPWMVAATEMIEVTKDRCSDLAKKAQKDGLL